MTFSIIVGFVKDTFLFSKYTNPEVQIIYLSFSPFSKIIDNKVELVENVHIS